MQSSVAGGEGGQKDVAELVEGHGLRLGSVFDQEESFVDDVEVFHLSQGIGQGP